MSASLSTDQIGIGNPLNMPNFGSLAPKGNINQGRKADSNCEDHNSMSTEDIDTAADRRIPGSEPEVGNRDLNLDGGPITWEKSSIGLINRNDKKFCNFGKPVSIDIFLSLTFVSLMLLVPLNFDRSLGLASIAEFLSTMTYRFVIAYTINAFLYYVVEIALPFVPGYCYTCMIKSGRRLVCAKTYMRNVKGPMISTCPFLLRDKKFMAKLGDKTCHVYPSERGYAFDELLPLIGDLEIGNPSTIMVRETIQFVQPVLRMISWVIIYFLQFGIEKLIILAVAAGIYWFGLDGWAVPLLAAGYILQMNIWMGIITISLIGLANWFIARMLTPPNHDKWEEIRCEEADKQPYPIGVLPSQRTHVYPFAGNNSVFEKDTFVTDTSMAPDNTEMFVSQSGAANLNSRDSGNCHAEAATATKWMVWSTQDHKGSQPNYTINIGGTFGGFPRMVCGLAMQPTLSGADSSRLHDMPSDPSAGRMVVNDYIGTTTEPVGSKDETFLPRWGVKGLGGAEFWSIHTYDIPIKALLAAAYANGTKVVNVVLHGDPALFAEEEGHLPFSSQIWQKRRTGFVRYRWSGTSDQTYEHYYRILFEHYFTDYVCVARDAFYVSKIHRFVFDVYHIKWTFQKSRPFNTLERQLVIKRNRNECFVPAMPPQINLLFRRFYRFRTRKQLEEYIQDRPEIKTLNQASRALLDNFFNSHGQENTHISLGEVKDLVYAAKYMHDLEKDIMETNVTRTTVKAFFGLEADKRVLASYSNLVYDYLVHQPTKSVTGYMIRQEEPYVLSQQCDFVERRNFMPAFDDDGLIAQLTMDEMPVTKVCLLYGHGITLMERLCFCLFGSCTQVPPILPLGKAESGGSLFEGISSLLLPTEIEYLVRDSCVIFVVKTADETVHYGSIDALNRPAVVYVNTDDETVCRVHYPTNMKSHEVIAKLNAIPADLQNSDWIPQGQAREYIAYNDPDQLFMNASFVNYQTEYNKIAPDDRVGWIARHPRPVLVDYHRLQIPIGSQYGQIPIFAQSEWCDLYDGRQTPGKSRYPPPHLFADGTIVNMRRLRNNGET